MAETSAMVASAVVVPEAVEQDISLSNNSALKRRQSSSAGIDTKRPRLSTDSQNYVKDDPRSPTSTATSPLRKGRGGKDEERARGKRLFGGLLGTLSQSSSSSAQKRRAEIEKKQQDKLRLQAEADDDEKRRKLEELTAARVVEQVKYDKQSMHLRHSNSLATANFLQTKVEPKLYYKPWKLRPQEEAQLKRQIQDVELEIDEELMKQQPDTNGTAPKSPANDDQLDKDMAPEESTSVRLEEPSNGGASAVTDANTNLDNTAADDTIDDTDQAKEDGEDQAKENGDDQTKENGDDQEEMILEGGEDAVIY